MIAIILMMNKQRSFPLRYSTLSPSPTPQSRFKFKSLSQIKQKANTMNTTLTKYRSTREMRKLQQKKKTKSQRSMYQYQRTSSLRKQNYETIFNNSDLIEIIKLKLHENDTPDLRIKTQYTMNRGELKSFIKKKKTFDFINNGSINIIKNMFPKKIDLIINQLKLRKTEEKLIVPRSQIIVDLKKRPNTALNRPTNSYLLKKPQIPPKITNSGQKKFIVTVPVKTEPQLNVSGWDIDNLQDQLIFQDNTQRKGKHKLKSKR